MNTIIKKIVNYIPWALLAILVGMFLAQTFQLASLDRDAQALSREVATLRAEQEYMQAQIEGQALKKAKLSTPADQSKVESSRIYTLRGMHMLIIACPS